MTHLTKAEENIMQILWSLKSGFVNDIISSLPQPKPAYNTVSTFLRILVTKGFVAYEAFGKSYNYYPVVSKEEYRSFATNTLLAKFFNNSVSDLLFFFLEHSKLTSQDLDILHKKILAKK